MEEASVSTSQVTRASKATRSTPVSKADVLSPDNPSPSQDTASPRKTRRPWYQGGRSTQRSPRFKTRRYSPSNVALIHVLTERSLARLQFSVEKTEDCFVAQCKAFGLEGSGSGQNQGVAREAAAKELIKSMASLDICDSQAEAVAGSISTKQRGHTRDQDNAAKAKSTALSAHRTPTSSRSSCFSIN